MSVQAFDIVFTGSLPNVVNEGAHLNTNITCLEVCGDFVFIGCRDGSLLKVGFKRSLSERTISLTKATHYYSTNCSITQMKALSALSQLLVLAEDTLIVLDLESLTLVRSLKFKQATCFSINENPLIDDPFTVELCVGSRKKIIYIHLTAEQARITKEISTSLTPCTLVMDGAHICFAMGKEYCLLDILSGEIQPLFSIDTPEQIPLINRVTKGEFLLSGPGGLGVFVLSQGFSEKPPIHFSDLVSALSFHHPYVIAVCKQGVYFYSVIDQQCKQNIAIDNIKYIVNSDGQVFASTMIDLFTLFPISWETQLKKLLSEERIEEALQLAANAHISSNDREQHNQMLRDLEQKVALHRLVSARFSDAMEMFETCNVDPREVIKLDLETMFSDEKNRQEALIFYLDFLQRWKVKSLSPDQKRAVDHALLKYLAKNDTDGVQLLDFIVDCDTEWNETSLVLNNYKRYHCLAMFYASRKKWEEAFTIWDQLIKKTVEDLHFPGYAFVAEQLTRSENILLIWRYSGEILKRDAEIGAKIFISDYTVSAQQRAVIDFLRNFPQSLRIFLEHLVTEKKEDDESVHTQLALLYIDDISNPDVNSNSPVHRMKVNKLRSLLRTSSRLDLLKLRNMLDSSRFPHEHAIICGRLGHHSVAINIFINQLKDFEAAEEYCACVDDQSSWNALLTACVTEARTHMFDKVTDLLRRRPHQFDVPSALLCLPDNTKFTLIAPFVNFAVREALHEKRMKAVQKALQEMDNIANRCELIQLENASFSIQPSSYCCVCKKRFELTDGFVRYPNGVLTHAKCAPNRHICPLTGHLFQVGSQ